MQAVSGAYTGNRCAHIRGTTGHVRMQGCREPHHSLQTHTLDEYDESCLYTDLQEGRYRLQTHAHHKSKESCMYAGLQEGLQVQLLATAQSSIPLICTATISGCWAAVMGQKQHCCFHLQPGEPCVSRHTDSVQRRLSFALWYGVWCCACIASGSVVSLIEAQHAWPVDWRCARASV